MELEPIGRVDDVNDLDLEPVIAPIVAYERKSKLEVIEKFRFRPMAPAGATFDVLRAMGPNGETPVSLIMAYLDASVLPEDSEALQEFLHRADIEIDPTTVAKVYRALSEVYGARPTMPSANSSGTGKPTKRTSVGVSRAQASRSRTSRSRSRST